MEYDEESKTFRLFDPEKRKVLLSRDVVCDETRVGYQFLTNQSGQLNDLFSISLNNHAEPDTTNIPGILNEQPNLDTEIEFLDTARESSSHTPDIEHQIPSSASSLSDSYNSQERRTRSPFPDRPTALAERRYPMRKRTPFNRYKDFWALVSKITEKPLIFAKAAKDKA